ncbi:MAG: hypothetical protein WDO24_24025 [Pseudomonadota bacterium]
MPTWRSAGSIRCVRRRTIALHPERALDAIAARVATPLALDRDQAAYGICEVVEENMANAARVQRSSAARS